MNEVQVTEIKQIEMEINFYKKQTVQSIFEIGNRLIKAKELVPYGEWENWLESKVEFSNRRAQQFMKVSREFKETNTSSFLTLDKMLELTTLDKEERETFIEENPVEDMTTRELRQAIKDKKELEKQVEELKNQEPVIIEKEVEKIVEVMPPDYQSLKGFQQLHANQCHENSKLEGEIQRLKRSVADSNFELEQLKKQQSLLERKAKLNEEEAKKYNKLTKDIENLTREKNDIGRQIAAKTELSGLVVRIEHLLKTELAPIKYSRAINEVSTDAIITRNLRDIVGRVQEWCEEMYQYIPMKGANKIINMEAIDYEYSNDEI